MPGQRQELQGDRAPGLVQPQHVSLAALPQVQIGELEAVLGAGDRRQPLPRLRLLGQPGDQQAQAGVLSTADPAAQLVQLADPEAVGVHHHHHGRVRHVDADLDHRGAHQHVDLPGAERAHHGVLLVAGEPAVHQPEPQILQRAALQSGEELHHRDRWRQPVVVIAVAPFRGGLLGFGLARLLVLVVLVDARRDDIGLPPGRDLLVDAFPRPGQPGRLLGLEDRARLDGLAPARKFAQRRGLQVSVGGQRQRPRDRGRRHHQQMRRDALRGLGPQPVSLLDAEPVLLVDDHHAEVVEFDGVLQQRMRADHDAGRP